MNAQTTVVDLNGKRQVVTFEYAPIRLGIYKTIYLKSYQFEGA